MTGKLSAKTTVAPSSPSLNIDADDEFDNYMVVDEEDYNDAQEDISRKKFLPGALNPTQFQPIYLFSTWKDLVSKDDRISVGIL